MLLTHISGAEEAIAMLKWSDGKQKSKKKKEDSDDELEALQFGGRNPFGKGSDFGFSKGSSASDSDSLSD